MKPEKHCEPSQDCAFRTTIGGQALIEGILMRGPEKQAIVVRNQEGELEVKEQKTQAYQGPVPHPGRPLHPRGGQLPGLPGGGGEGPHVVGGVLS